MSIHAILTEIASTSSTLEKQAILDKNKDNALFQKVLKYAYDNSMVYYVKVIPKYVPNESPKTELEDGLNILKDMSDRIVTGKEAMDTLIGVLINMSPNDRDVIHRIIAKDLKCGIGDKQINKANPGLIPTFGYQGALPFDKKAVEKLFASNDLVESDVKADGRFVSLIVSEESCKKQGNLNGIKMLSRQGKPSFLNNTELLIDVREVASNCQDFAKLETDGIVLTGELIMLDGTSRYTANGIISSLVSITEKQSDGIDVSKEVAKFVKEQGMTLEDAAKKIHVKVWDYVPLSVYLNGGVYPKKRGDRLEILERAIGMAEPEYIHLIEYKMVSTYEEAMDHFSELIGRGEEGTILKNINAPWKSGKSKENLKLKLEVHTELKIVGFNEGRNRYVGQLGSLICESSDGLLACDPFGFSDSQRIEMWESRDFYMGKIVEVKANGISKDVDGNYSLLHPIFIQVRTDKVGADSLEDIKRIQNMVLGLS